MKKEKVKLDSRLRGNDKMKKRYNRKGRRVYKHGGGARRRAGVYQIGLGPIRQWINDRHGRVIDIHGNPEADNSVRSWVDMLAGKTYPGLFRRVKPFAQARMDENLAANLPYIAKSANLPCLSWPDYPVFIIGGGPSLAKNVEHLANINSGLRHRVIAINTALPVVHEVVRPDVFFTADWRGDKSWVKGVDVEGMHAIFSYYAAPWLVELPWRKRTFFAHSLPPRNGPHIPAGCEELIQLASGMHSTFNAFHFSFLMGGNPLIFAGCDYSFAPKGDLHVIKHEDASSENTEKHIMSYPDVFGKPAQVRGDMVLMMLYMNAAAVFAKETNTEVWNATEGGIWGHDGVVVQRKLKGAVHEINQVIKSKVEGQKLAPAQAGVKGTGFPPSRE